MTKHRAAGILMHISSLPSAHGIGDLGAEAYKFADFLNGSQQKYWQILPLTPISADQSYSPYSSVSSMAGNPMLISLERMRDSGCLLPSDVPEPLKTTDKVDFERSWKIRDTLLTKSGTHIPSKFRPAFEAFCDREAFWLDDYALFMALKASYRNAPWYKWPAEFRERKLRSLLRFSSDKKTMVQIFKWQQFVFFDQWKDLKRYCNDLNIRLIGDVPFYTSYDSVDVWSRQEIFNLNDNGSMAGVAGVPPDYFNSKGQLWGMPVYRWDVLKDVGYDWWLRRLRKNLELVDVLRLDHFRAFHDYWEVPAKHKTAVNGEWKSGPGAHFFETLKQEFGRLPFLAEDLGDITPGVHKLRKQFGLPGMKVLQFAFGDDMPSSDHIPHNYQNDFFVYTGTHDNNTTCGWFKKDLKEKDRRRVADYLNQTVHDQNIHEHMIRAAYATVAQTVIIPVQDVLALDEKARMNTPASTSRNWQWRMLPGALSEKEKVWLSYLTRLYNRV